MNCIKVCLNIYNRRQAPLTTGAQKLKNVMTQILRDVHAQEQMTVDEEFFMVLVRLRCGFPIGGSGGSL